MRCHESLDVRRDARPSGRDDTETTTCVRKRSDRGLSARQAFCSALRASLQWVLDRTIGRSAEPRQDQRGAEDLVEEADHRLLPCRRMHGERADVGCVPHLPEAQLRCHLSEERRGSHLGRIVRHDDQGGDLAIDGRDRLGQRHGHGGIGHEVDHRPHQLAVDALDRALEVTWQVGKVGGRPGADTLRHDRGETEVRGCRREGDLPAHRQTEDADAAGIDLVTAAEPFEGGGHILGASPAPGVPDAAAVTGPA